LLNKAHLKLLYHKVLNDIVMYFHSPQGNANVFIFSFGKPFLKKKKGLYFL